MREQVVQSYSSKEDWRGRPVRESTLFMRMNSRRLEAHLVIRLITLFAWGTRLSWVTNINGRQFWAGSTAGHARSWDL